MGQNTSQTRQISRQSLQTTLDLAIGLSRHHQEPKKDFVSKWTFTDVASKQW